MLKWSTQNIYYSWQKTKKLFLIVEEIFETFFCLTKIGALNELTFLEKMLFLFNNMSSITTRSNIFLYFTLIGWSCLSVLLTAFDIFGPVANILRRIENKVCWTWHMVFPFSFTHIVLSAVSLIWVIANVTFFFITCYFIC